jgi:hypothetical protein
MERMKQLALLLLLLPGIGRAQVREVVDSALVARIKAEGTDRSEVMALLNQITDLNGPRLTNSPGYRKAAEHARKTLETWGLQSRTESWGKFGRGWSLQKFQMSVKEPYYFPVVAFPKAWTPGIKGTVSAEVIYLDVKKEEDLAKYKGQLKGKVVMFNPPPRIRFGFEPVATRFADSTLLNWANDEQTDRGRRFLQGSPEDFTYKKWKLCMDEGALAVLDHSTGRGDNGAVTVSGASVPVPPGTPFDKRPRIYDEPQPATLPQIALASEHYNRLHRLLLSGAKPKVELQLEVAFTPAEDGYNVIGEIAGTDRKDEIVMIGAHLDSWHSATGTTDNGAGSAVMLEAIRIIKSLGIQPHRTIRIGLWGGEEQGLLGSRGYVTRHMGERIGDSVALKPEGSKVSAYFNMDNGTGKFRGIYLQENEACGPIFREWFRPFHKAGAATIATFNTGGTDHQSFDRIGIPAFQFIQDPIEYSTRTHHTSLDGYDKALEEDLRHNAIIVAVFAWLAANREEMLPRKD